MCACEAHAQKTQTRIFNENSLVCKNDKCMVFENHRKSLIKPCERSHFEETKVHQKCQKWSILASFWKSGQIVLPVKSPLIEQKLIENA